MTGGALSQFFNQCGAKQAQIVSSCGVFMMQRLIDVIGLIIFMCLSVTLLLAIWA